MTRMTFKETIDWANARDVGQFHLFDKQGIYQQTWRSFQTAVAVANKHGWLIYNDSGERV